MVRTSNNFGGRRQHELSFYVLFLTLDLNCLLDPPTKLDSIALSIQRTIKKMDPCHGKNKVFLGV